MAHPVHAFVRKLGESDGCIVIEYCANPECKKVLHYLREGRIFAFTITEPPGATFTDRRRVEHYWLCGRCCCLFNLKREGGIISLVIGPSVFLNNTNDKATA